MTANGYTGNPPGSGGGGGSTAWADITGKPSTFPPSAHTQAASTISDSTSVGRAVLTAADAAAGRTALGAGTSSLALGSTGSTAAAGNHTHVVLDVSGLQALLDAKAPLASPTFTGTVSGVTKAMVGLGSVDNTSDAGKPVSTAQQAALDTKQAIIKKWNGSSYVAATGAEIYVGAGTPTSPADGSVWLTS